MIQNQTEYPSAEANPPTFTLNTSQGTNAPNNASFCSTALRDRRGDLQYGERRSGERYKKTCSNCKMKYRGPTSRTKSDLSLSLEFQSHLGFSYYVNLQNDFNVQYKTQ
jgi:hypothetical protein